jgi:hypothetical protein
MKGILNEHTQHPSATRLLCTSNYSIVTSLLHIEYAWALSGKGGSLEGLESLWTDNSFPMVEKELCGPVLEAPCGGGAGLGRDRPRADPAARWRALVWGAGPAGSEGGRRPVMRGSLATGPGYRRWDSDGGPRLEARSLGRWTRWPE